MAYTAPTNLAPAITNETYTNPEAGHHGVGGVNGFSNGNGAYSQGSHSPTGSNGQKELLHGTHGTGMGKDSPQVMRRAVTPGGHPVDTSQPAFPEYHRKFADAAPLGLFSFAMATFCSAMFNLEVRGITTPNLIVCMAIGSGGLLNILAGMWEFAAGNTFAATTFTSYGGFWFSYALIYWPSSGILYSYLYTADGTFAPTAARLSNLYSALAIWLLAWMIVTFLFFFATLRGNLALVGLFVTIFFQFMFLAIANLKPLDMVFYNRVGGGFGLGTAFFGFYLGAASILTPGVSIFSLPVFSLKKGPMTFAERMKSA